MGGTKKPKLSFVIAVAPSGSRPAAWDDGNLARPRVQEEIKDGLDEEFLLSWIPLLWV